MNNDPSLLVNLNIGGVYYVTSMNTLLHSNSFFSGLVASGTSSPVTDIFVDRDPTHFRHILNWMRGVHYLPEEDATLQELLWEADFYSLKEMHDAIVRSQHRYSTSKSLHYISQDLRQRP